MLADVVGSTVSWEGLGYHAACFGCSTCGPYPSRYGTLHCSGRQAYCEICGRRAFVLAKRKEREAGGSPLKIASAAPVTSPPSTPLPPNAGPRPAQLPSRSAKVFQSEDAESQDYAARWQAPPIAVIIARRTSPTDTRQENQPHQQRGSPSPSTPTGKQGVPVVITTPEVGSKDCFSGSRPALVATPESKLWISRGVGLTVLRSALSCILFALKYSTGKKCCTIRLWNARVKQSMLPIESRSSALEAEDVGIDRNSMMDVPQRVSQAGWRKGLLVKVQVRLLPPPYLDYIVY